MLAYNFFTYYSGQCRQHGFVLWNGRIYNKDVASERANITFLSCSIGQSWKTWKDFGHGSLLL